MPPPSVPAKRPRGLGRLPLLGLLWGLLLVAGGCLESQPPGSLELTLRGPSYPRPRCAKGPLALGPVHSRGEPISGAALRLSPGSLSAKSDGEGLWRLEELTPGEYQLAVAAPGFLPLSQQLVVAAGQARRLALQLTPCVEAGQNKVRVGFDSDITLAATIQCPQGWEQVSYVWTQLEGPDVSASVASWEGPTLTFRTRPLEEVRPLPARPQLLSFSPDQAGQYVFEVRAQSPAGEVSRDTVMVSSTSVIGSVNSVPPFELIHFVGGPLYQSSEYYPRWNWTIDLWPAGWPKTLQNGWSKTPSVRPMPGSKFEQQQDIAIRNLFSPRISFSLVIGYWDMVNRDCGRSDCHATLQSGWEQTRHASTWQRLLDGEMETPRGPAAESCATCHALGYDRATPNRGYDDIADLVGVTFPEQPAPGSYAALPERLKEVSNVYCLACHGPARVDPPVAEQPGRFSVGVCARCHDRLPEQDLVAQWRTSRMARTISGELNAPESHPDCKRCHSAQGVYYHNFALGRPPNERTLVLSCCDNLQPITCQACHSPMYAENEAQVFRYGAVQTESGLDLQEIGAGALCSTCHNVGHTLAQAEREQLAPHAPQSELSYGQAGFALPAPAGLALPPLSGVACAQGAGQGCVTCHMDEGPGAGEPGYRRVGDHTFSMISAEGQENLRPCQACHAEMQSFDPRARGDYDGDGLVEGVREEFDGLAALLAARLRQALAERGYQGCGERGAGVWFQRGSRNQVVIVDAAGLDLGDCDGDGQITRRERPRTFAAADVLLYQAAYNYLLLQADKSRGLHNYPYAIKLLQRTLAALSLPATLPDWELYRAGSVSE